MSSDGPGLTPTSSVVLGIVAHRGPSTPYDMKVYVASSIGYFWSFPHAQLYSEPDRLVEAGLLTVEQEPAGRRRKVYAITAAGREALAAWVSEPTDELPQLRNPALLRLFFGWLTDRRSIQRLARAQAEAHAARLGTYRELAAAIAELDEFAFPFATLQAGIRYEEMLAEYWAGIAQDPPSAPKRRR